MIFQLCHLVFIAKLLLSTMNFHLLIIECNRASESSLIFKFGLQDRIKGYMGRVKEIEDKEKAPKLDKEASKRFIRSALWLEAQKKTFAGTSLQMISNLIQVVQSSVIFKLNSRKF